MCLFHGWLMTAYLRGEPGSAKQAALLRAIYSGDLTPSAALTSLSYGLMTRLPSLEDAPPLVLEVNERIALEAQLSVLTSDIASCEKLLRTPIPLGYTRYSVRFLWIWLTLLPFALTNTFVNFGVGTWWEVKALFAHPTGSGVRAPAQPPAGGGVAEGRVAGEGAEAVEGAARGSPSQSRQAN
ncbi:hypothetical protein EMIHUDRAFT_219324 [Emiliania huxleyi CCMP1516]|uniref:Uncharacterized protein n=2 Tax=Emiliania huxleyi TaxID=2903 RepID=A0A0D3I583_EMIH1|nr:hypothetical protein EMIHUDRAFT_219324 [Emiliania huxleyi CCMP1516]EOD06418.1 hypothetical protein EMIHUDRAFT_219324 [Emiliania huxleyi CCMP1516]|eukprot:XP_005758847.1 hypothetical protein EMIHUDRAFT_219324 [Emiliania huxleyi CCMP1516]